MTSRKFVTSNANLEALGKNKLHTIALVQKATMGQSFQQTSKQRHEQLQRLQNWCMDRISQLSLHYSIDDATALTAEHLELLKSVDQTEALWIQNDKPIGPAFDALN